MKAAAALSLAQELESLGSTLEQSMQDLTVGVALVDASRRFRWQNATSIARIGDRRGTEYLDSIAPDYRRAAQTELTRLLFGSAEPRRVELVAVSPEGRRVRTLVSGTPVRGPEGVVGVIFTGMPLNWSDELVRPNLPPRQLETLRLLSAGGSTESIADELGVTRETARNYIRRLLKGLGVHSRIEAVAHARTVGLVSTDPSGSSDS